MKIGLTYTGWGEKHQNYVQWLKDKDRSIEVIRLSVSTDPELIKSCDALVLSGGVDIDPALYGGASVYPKSEAARGWRKDRDAFERSVFEYALGHHLPVLGVCRGLQLINVLLGGTLVQDLGEKGDETHEAIGDMDKQHSVRVERDSLLYAIAGAERGIANSAHHQAIDRLGRDLKINCLADDRTIEGIEWADPAGKPFMLAVQWHPERMFINKMPDGGLYKRIRDRYIEEIGRSKPAKQSNTTT